MHLFVEQLLLSRFPTSAPAIFICLAHQLAAQAHIRLIQRAVREVLSLTGLDRDRQGKSLKALHTVCQQIVSSFTELLPYLIGIPYFCISFII